MNNHKRGGKFYFLCGFISVRDVFFFILLLLLIMEGRSAYAGYASIVIDADTGEVIYEKNADTKNYPASLTKMMTLYLLFEALEEGKLSLSQKLSVSRKAASMSPTKLWLKRGQKICVENALLGLVTESANDAAVVIAEALGGSEQFFARMMTQKARQLGMKNTTFYNASGLPHRKQLSTARDMAILSRALLRNFPQYYSYFSKRAFRFRGRTYRNHNKLLVTYKGTDGIKTGYTRASKYNLAASAVRHKRRIIAVAFGCKSSYWRNHHVAQLLDKGFTYIAQSDHLPGAQNPGVINVNSYTNNYLKKTDFPSLYFNNSNFSFREKSKDHNGSWGIQIGTFSRYSTAYRTAINGQMQASKLLVNSDVVINLINDENGIHYKACLVGLSISDAISACGELLRTNDQCRIIQTQ
jgi:D-alanyl-D-alanine carboxypeptidase